ncbi:MAG: glutaminyl-peptide cyclotransferase [Bryobacteraceae bacterium]|jgi:glutaminyl-peptide cyclotransferase
MIKFLILCGLVPAVLSAAEQTPEYGYEVIHTYPHDSTAFTQGLEYHGGYLYEGTGLNGRSTVRKVKLETGQVVQRVEVDPFYFGQGITVLNQQIFELTWKTQTGFVYSQATFRKKQTFNYPGEGWGLANDGRNIYMSDGTDQIRVWDPLTLQEKRRIMVRDHDEPVMNLNELEWVRGEIYANVWLTERVARISPMDGRVLGWIDLTNILPAADHKKDTDILNGIAYDALGKRLFVTGKLWPKLFEIKVVPKTPPQ